MNKLEIFNQVKSHLLTQNAKAISDSGSCRFNIDGLKCAVGCLIPDGHPGLEAYGGIATLLRDYPDLKTLWGVSNDSDIGFLRELQAIHDHKNPSSWPRALNDFEEMYLEQA